MRREETDLYRYYDKEDRLLYVGISLHAAYRASQHKRSKGWWSSVARMDRQVFTDRSAAVKAERRAIENERPLHNKQHNTQTACRVSPHRRIDNFCRWLRVNMKDSRSPEGDFARDWLSDKDRPCRVRKWADILGYLRHCTAVRFGGDVSPAIRAARICWYSYCELNPVKKRPCRK